MRNILAIAEKELKSLLRVADRLHRDRLVCVALWLVLS